MTIKTPEQIAAEVFKASNWFHVEDRHEFVGAMIAAIEADRAQRAHEDAMQKRWEVDTALTIAERIIEPMQFAEDGYATGDSAYYECIEERIIAAAGEGIQAGRAQRQPEPVHPDWQDDADMYRDAACVDITWQGWTESGAQIGYSDAGITGAQAAAMFEAIGRGVTL